MKLLRTFLENLRTAPPAARRLLRCGLLLTNALLLLALVLFWQALPFSGGTAPLYHRACALLESGAAVLLFSGLGSALLRR